jgi:hypothetical protein
MYKKLLIIFITTLFACSALEIEIGETKQTFFDEYDTYIPSNPTTVTKNQASVSKHKCLKTLKKPELKNWFLGINAFNKTEHQFSRLTYHAIQSSNPSLNILLQKRVLRI